MAWIFASVVLYLAVGRPRRLAEGPRVLGAFSKLGGSREHLHWQSMVN